MMDKILCKFKNTIIQFDKPKKRQENRDFNKSILPKKGEILTKDNKVILKAISDKEYENYMAVSYECAIMKSFFKEESFKRDLWESFLEDTAANYSIFDRVTGEYIGYCGIKNLNKKNWELAIELLKKYRNQGYGYHALSLMLSALTNLTGKRIYRSRVEPDNYASQKLMKKIGAKPNGISEMFIHGEDLQRFQEENRDLIDNKIRALANEFKVEPIDLIGHVLEFRIEW